MTRTTPRVLTVDCETSPNVADVWGLFNQNVSLAQLRESTRVISFAAKWYGEKPVHFWSDFHDGHDAMVAAAHQLINEADIVVHYNGRTFDMPHFRREFLVAGLLPPSPVREVDLLQVAKKQFRFSSNKLQYVSTYLGLKGKTQHTGHDLWVRCMAGDPKAWALMKRYNCQDVRLTEELYDRLRPWVPDHPNMGQYVAGEHVESCPNCGGTNLIREGYAYLTAGKYPRFHCADCGRWSRGKKAEAIVLTRSIA